MATQNEHNQMLSVANPNTRLYRLKKPELVQIRLHHGVNPVGTKLVLTERIIQARDDNFRSKLYHTYSY